ncbi:Polyadenylate-binding protein 2 [Cyphomyrmex costatus]|uniref:Polyadenylate-binding protein 2 n=1 Tax=Cyphomyrmex costatus TaxID=456900 RepID=A0A195C0C8_9HYME|nr:Polyadenylate-binding protein 2 [Cyphomyrmex costatus]
MSESDLLAGDHIDGLDGLENGQDGDTIMQCDGVKRELGEANVDDPELEAIKARVREMEEEAEKLKQLQSEVDKQMNMGSPPGITSPLNMSLEDKMEVDNRSIYVGNVDYGATAEELEQHFHGCGSVNRVTILCNKFDGHPKGFAYIEFAERDSVQTAMAMDESMFRGRQIKVMPKRTNKPEVPEVREAIEVWLEELFVVVHTLDTDLQGVLGVTDVVTICHIDHFKVWQHYFTSVKVSFYFNLYDNSYLSLKEKDSAKVCASIFRQKSTGLANHYVDQISAYGFLCTHDELPILPRVERDMHLYNVTMGKMVGSCDRQPSLLVAFANELQHGLVDLIIAPCLVVMAYYTMIEDHH